jgi:hypothetical protein
MYKSTEETTAKLKYPNYRINIAFQPICHGHYLTYIIDRFSKLTPEIKELPFEKNGISHKEIKYSNFVRWYHPNNKFLNQDDPHIFITVEQQDLFFLHRLAYTRPDGESTPFSNFSTNGTKVILSNFFIKNFKDKFKEIYNLDLDKNNSIPKFILRDFVKINYLNINEDNWLKVDHELKKKLPKNVFLIELKNFWNLDSFIKILKKCSDHLALELDINQELYTVHELFLKKLHNFETKDRVLTIINSIENKQYLDISNIDLIEESQISAWIETTFPFVTIPLINNFFSNTKEILEYVENFPNHYKAMNPNLPTFNNIPNPFFLYRQKTK